MEKGENRGVVASNALGTEHSEENGASENGASQNGTPSDNDKTNLDRLKDVLHIVDKLQHSHCLVDENDLQEKYIILQMVIKIQRLWRFRRWHSERKAITNQQKKHFYDCQKQVRGVQESVFNCRSFSDNIDAKITTEERLKKCMKEGTMLKEALEKQTIMAMDLNRKLVTEKLALYEKLHLVKEEVFR